MQTAVNVTIEIPRWSFVKYAITEEGGHVDFLSPLPCPFNYGFVADLVGGDQMPLDAIVLGPRIQRAKEVTIVVRAVIRFTDSGEVDDKIVCSHTPLTRVQLALLRIGFQVYVMMKRVVNFCRKRSGVTRYDGIEFGSDAIKSTLVSRPH